MDLSLAQALLDFIGRSPSPFHVVDNLAQRLQKEGYTELYEHQPWNLEMGGRYYLRRNGSSLLSFRIPQTAPTGFLLSAAHSDSPSFKLKASAERVGAHYVQLETEGYGGMLMASWFDRPLTLAGRVLIRENGAIREKLVYLDR
ncbi:MAG: M18 family aminopeptidase, partial [Oscillospiraceae bacterium]|nr:M18 family aminopeptidase [Oscillospiraceae bacterium]